LARVLLITSDILLGLAAETGESGRGRSLAEIEAALRCLPDADLELIAVQLRAVAEWRGA
jgi:hypothetical protein